MTKQLESHGVLVPSTRAEETGARVVITMYGLAAIASVFVLLARATRHPGQSTFVEQAFGIVNIPLASTPVSVLVLWMVWGALARRKRVALIAVGAFQLLGAVLSALTLAGLMRDGFRLPGPPFAGPLLGAQSVLAILIGLAAPFLLHRIRRAFPARIRSALFLRALLITGIGLLVSLLALAVLLNVTNVRGVGDAELFLIALKRSLGINVHLLPHEAVRGVFLISQVVSALLVASLCAGLYVLLRPSSREAQEGPEAEERIREQLLHMDAPDSLSYFSTRRDKRVFTSSDGLASLTYRLIGPVCLVSADPIGPRASWRQLTAEWMSACRTYGWSPAVIGASEAAARIYVEQGLSVVSLGDEAILRPDRFTLNNAAMTGVRHSVQRARRAGLDVGIHRMRDLDAEQREALATTVRNWRTSRERGFSMALGRFNDEADQESIVVVAHDAAGELFGVLTFVPWGANSLSLDLMLRHPKAPNGANELMISELMAFGRDNGIQRVSLNFAVFRSIFADSDRLGAGLATRVNSGILGVLDRFTQVESLYRANQKFDPEWSPRFFLFDGAFSILRAGLAAGVAEGFLPELPWNRPYVREPMPREALDRLHGQTLTLRSASVDDVMHAPNAYTRLRLAQASRLRANGMSPYPLGSRETTRLGLLSAEDWNPSRRLSLYGRARNVRKHGGVVFVDLVDGGAALQAVFERDSTEGFEAVRTGIGTGDLIVVEGAPGASRNGTPSLLASSWSMAAKTLHPVPFRGLTDPEARLRRRSTELITNPAQAERLRLRSRAVHALREVLTGAGFIEVETPMLNTVHGGATARPFKTFINAYGVDLTMRIAPELQLKRLLVGGLGPVFEIGRNFRNEGADATHNPEFTALEAYEPFGDYTTMRHLTEKLIKHAALQAHGSVSLPLRTEPGAGPAGGAADGAPAEGDAGGAAGVASTEATAGPLGSEHPRKSEAATGAPGLVLTDVSRPWPVVSVLDAVSAAVGQKVSLDTDIETLLELCRIHEVPFRPEMGPGALIEELYGEIVEPATVFPTFYVDFPVETSPLAGPHRHIPGLAERWDLVANGMEIGTAYSELADPVEQRRRLTEQSLKAAHGDPEAMAVDEDFLYSLETGMPPAGGLGIGVDRMVMLLTGTNIRDVLTFPFVRPLNS